MKINVSQAQSNLFVFKETPAYKRGLRRSGQQSSTTATHGDAVRILSSVLITVQSDTR